MSFHLWYMAAVLPFNPRNGNKNCGLKWTNNFYVKNLYNLQRVETITGNIVTFWVVRTMAQ